MKIVLKQIPSEGLQIKGEESPSILEINEEGINFHAPIGYNLLAQLMGHSLLVQGRLFTSVTLRCVRCLCDFVHSLEVPEFVFHRVLSGEDVIDLTAEVREDILLQLPAYPVCNGQCKGLCSKCGRDLNTGECRCQFDGEQTPWTALDEVLRTTRTRKND